MKAPADLSQKLLTLTAHPTRARLFLELRSGVPRSATALAQRLNVSVQNVHYHLKLMLKSGLVTIEDQAEKKFTERTYSLVPEVANNLNLVNLNKAVLASSPQGRRNFVMAICTVSAAQLLALAQYYEKLPPDEFDEEFLIKNSALIGMFPIVMEGAGGLSNELGALLQHCLEEPSLKKGKMNGFVFLGVLPYRMG